MEKTFIEMKRDLDTFWNVSHEIEPIQAAVLSSLWCHGISIRQQNHVTGNAEVGVRGSWEVTQFLLLVVLIVLNFLTLFTMTHCQFVVLFLNLLLILRVVAHFQQQWPVPYRYEPQPTRYLFFTWQSKLKVLKAVFKVPTLFFYLFVLYICALQIP